MRLLDIFKREWKHHDPNVRFAAVTRLTNPKVLAKIAVNDESWVVRKAAVENPNLADLDLLDRIIEKDEHSHVRQAALQQKMIKYYHLNR